MTKLVVKLILIVALQQLWGLFSDEEQWKVWAWDQVGLDITQKYDIHLFYDYPEKNPGEKLKWKAYDIGYLLTFCFMMSIIKSHVPVNGLHIRRTIYIVYLFSIFRLLEYVLFRFGTDTTAMVIGIILFSLYFRIK